MIVLATAELNLLLIVNVTMPTPVATTLSLSTLNMLELDEVTITAVLRDDLGLILVDIMSESLNVLSLMKS